MKFIRHKAKYKHTVKFNIEIKKAIAVLTMLAVALQLFPAGLFTSEVEVEADSASARTTQTMNGSIVNSLYKSRMDSLGWINVSKGVFDSVNPAMWAKTGLVPYSGFIQIDDTYTYKTADGTATINFSEITKDSPVWNDANKNVENGYSDGWTYQSSYKQINFKNKIYSTKNYESVLISEQTTVSDGQIGYDVCYDSTLQGWYREYHVYTADQLAWLIYVYGDSEKAENHKGDTFALKLKVSDEDLKQLEITGTACDKLAIKLESDLDLGGDLGEKDKHWRGFRNPNVLLDVDGQGHTIYNGYFTADYYSFCNNYDKGTFNRNPVYNAFLYQDQKISFRNLTFSNMLICNDGGMFGHSVLKAYFNNVNWENCISVANRSSSAIVLGNSYSMTYFKDCTISNCYVKGGGHSALFASFNAGYCISRNSNDYYSYIDDPDLTINGGENTKNQYVYYTEVPATLEQVEMAWQNRRVKKEDGKLVVDTEQASKTVLTGSYPCIYENCATVDSYVYEGGEHSGTFVSCMQGNIIFRHCFTNCTIYGSSKIGTFIGMNIGSGGGFFYPLDGKRQYLNAYFDECFASGSVEGTSRIGGFVGSTFYGDSRSRDYDTRGRVVYVNCYSTASVGMQYAGQDLGGFVGSVQGNGGTGGVPEDEQYHLFRNCYAAGEVGSMLTDVSTSAQNAVGGFAGTIDNDYPQVTFENCYYDKQTTAMRERAIGMASDTKSDNANIIYQGIQLCEDGRFVGVDENQGVKRIQGVYTQPSAAKEVQGLVHDKDCEDWSVKMNDTNASDTTGSGDVWEYYDEYYPVINDFLNLTSTHTEGNEQTEAMYTKRQQLFHNYAMASVATVFLDHYDEVLTDTGELTNDKDKVTNIKLVYDTVRDITSKFEFTTDATNNIKWAVDSDRNGESGFISKIDTAGKGFTIETPVGGTTVSEAHNPDVIKIVADAADGDRYKCVEFAPGRQWVTVTARQHVDEPLGTRELRLLPTAYLSAGGSMEIGVLTDENEKVTNTYTYNYSTKPDGGSTSIKLPSFNHSVGVGFAITDKNRMASASGSQVVLPYTSDNTSDFALYAGFSIQGDSLTGQIASLTGNGMVGLDGNGKMFPQEFDVTGQENNSTDGMTMAKVYKTKQGKVVTTGEGTDESAETYVLEKGDEITNSEDLEKWSGGAVFDASDMGYYYIEYYWRLSDGRFLSDMKLVKVTTNFHSVEIVTGILNEEHTVTEAANADGFKTSIDQFVVAGNAGGNYQPKFPSKNEPGYSAENAKNYYNGVYNEPGTYYGDTYYLKSSSINTAQANSVLGWYRSTDYRLSSLIVEFCGENGEWRELARVDNTNPEFDFSKAEYSYTYTSYSVEQDPETKLFKVTKKDNASTTFNVSKTAASTTGIVNYIAFSLSKSEGDTFTELNDNIRVTALFRRNYADVAAEKDVLLNAPDPTEAKTGNDTWTSLAANTENYSVDNSAIDDDNTEARKAVLSGDTLTYRMKLKNDGFFDSDVVTVTDSVPEGCTYVAGSAKLYRQGKDTTSGVPKYYAVEEMSTNGYSVKPPTVENPQIEWTIPTVELEYDYFAEYQVTVGQLKASEASAILTNQAEWDFVTINGDVKSGSAGAEFTSISAYKQDAIFDMDISAEPSDGGKFNYEVKLKIQDGNITLSEGGRINVQLQSPVTPDSVEIYDDTTHIEAEPSIDGNILTFSDLSAASGYTISFRGDAPTVTESQEAVFEVRATYSDGSSSAVGNAIAKTMRMTNEVSTDRTHLYINIEKTITPNDPEQTFIFKIERYQSAASAEPDEIFYTQVRCAAAVEDTEYSGYSGSRLLQVDKRGYYVVTEVSDWSATDYDFGSVSVADDPITADTLEKNNNAATANRSVSFDLPRSRYVSAAFPTAYGLAENYPTASFKNTESKYAYRSGQAYAENVITVTAAS